MELNNIQKSWDAMEEKLKANQIMTESILIKMVESRGRKNISKLIIADLWAVFVLLFLGVFFLINKDTYEQFNEYVAYSVNLIIVVIFPLGILLAAAKLYFLLKIDLSNTIKSNVLLINKYKILFKSDFAFGMIAVIAILLPLSFLSHNLDNNIGVYVGVILFFAALAFSISIFFYAINIKYILSTLAELKDLKEK